MMEQPLAYLDVAPDPTDLHAWVRWRAPVQALHRTRNGWLADAARDRAGRLAVVRRVRRDVAVVQRHRRRPGRVEADVEDPAGAAVGAVAGHLAVVEHKRRFEGREERGVRDSAADAAGHTVPGHDRLVQGRRRVVEEAAAQRADRRVPGDLTVVADERSAVRDP